MNTNMTTRSKIAALVLSALALFAKVSPATTVEPPDFATLVKQADAIFVGDVMNIESAWINRGDNRIIVSQITFKVIKALKGNPANPYVLKLHGGTVGDTTMEVDGVPKFKVGSRTLLFVENNGTQFCPLVGIMHGYFRVAKDGQTGTEKIFKHDGTPLQNVGEIDQTHRRYFRAFQDEQKQMPAGGGINQDDFEAAIKNHLQTIR